MPITKNKSPKKSPNRKKSIQELNNPFMVSIMNISLVWIVIIISFLAVCIVVFGGKYHALATRDFNNVDIDGRLRMGGLDTKSIVGYTGVFNNTAAGFYWVLNTPSLLPPILVGNFPINAIIIPANYVVISTVLKPLIVPTGPGGTQIALNRSTPSGNNNHSTFLANRQITAFNVKDETRFFSTQNADTSDPQDRGVLMQNTNTLVTGQFQIGLTLAKLP